MARHFEENESAVSLFPFLSILACVIGVLTLMITSLALTAMAGGSGGLTEEELARAEKLPQVRKESDAMKVEIADLEKRVSSASLNESRLKALKAEHDGLKKKEQAFAQALTRETALAAEVKKLQSADKQKKDRVAALSREKATAQAKLNQLSGDLNQRTAPAGNRTLQLRRGAGSQKYAPFFVEAAAKGKVILHTGKQAHVFSTGKLASDKAFNELLKNLAGKANQQLVILVRDDGIGTMNAINKYVANKNVTTGRLPLLGQGPIDLNQVKK